MSLQEINNKSMLRVGTILRGIYRIDSYLSSGGFGNTYVATNIEFDERFAIKEFFMKGVTQRDDNQTTVSVSNSENKNSFLSQREKFKKEARRIRQLKNQHIVAVHDLFEENGTAYYVMDYVDGENLSVRLKRTGKPMTELEVREIMPQVLDALKSVHDAGIWHLDLKPANIMVDKSGDVKLIDFGASKQMDANKGGATTSTAISYTNGYAPREQMEQNYDKFGPWTDIYALGATIYNLLTNKRPPLPSDIDDDETEDKHHSLPFPVGISDDMKKMVLQLMHTNRKKRPQDISEVWPLLDSPSSKSEESEADVVETKVEELEDNEVTIIAASPNEEIDVEQDVSVESETNQTKSVSVIQEVQEEEENKKDEENQEEQAEQEEFYDFDDESSNRKKIYIYIGVAVVAILLCVLLYNGFGSSSKEPVVQKVENIGPKTVESMEFLTAIGGCKYTGFVDKNNLPDSIGEANFNDGRYYKGGFEHGVLTGDECYFKYANGDEFKGQFRNNRFHYGTYVIASDKSYYVGEFTNGQPSKGKWYDKKGKVTEIVK